MLALVAKKILASLCGCILEVLRFQAGEYILDIIHAEQAVKRRIAFLRSVQQKSASSTLLKQNRSYEAGHIEAQ